MIEIHGPANITEETTDAIVNAANSSLLGGGGVDGAIHRAGGPAILGGVPADRQQNWKLPDGPGSHHHWRTLPAKHVIHTVGPIYCGGGRSDAETLASCHRESAANCRQHELSASLSFPAISTGAFGYPVSEAAPIAISATVEALVCRPARHADVGSFSLTLPRCALSSVPPKSFSV